MDQMQKKQLSFEEYNEIYPLADEIVLYFDQTMG